MTQTNLLPWVVTTAILLSGCAAPEERQESPPTSPAEAETGTVNITVRKPRSVHTETFEYAVTAEAPDDSRVSGTIFQRVLVDCQPPGCVAREEGHTGDFVGGTPENQSLYPYLRSQDVQYLGVWRLTIEEIQYKEYQPELVQPRTNCIHITFEEHGKTPNASNASEVTHPKQICLPPGEYMVSYDGGQGSLTERT